MKHNPTLFRIILTLTCLFILAATSLEAGIIPTVQASTQPQSIEMFTPGLGFTYQGHLEKSGAPYTGTCGFTFSLWTDATSTTPAAKLGADQPMAGVVVTGGVFNVILNDSDQFGATAFDANAPRWLQIIVQCVGDSASTTLGRQKLVAPPYALTRASADSAYLNITGPETMTGSSSVAILSVNQTGSGHGIRGSSTASQTAGVYGSGVYAGVWGVSTGPYPGSGVSGIGSNGALGGYFRSDTNPPDPNAISLMVDGNARVNQNLTVVGNLNVTGTISPITRYVPITIGDLVTDQSVGTADSMTGYIFPDGMYGGTITFPLPADYTPDTPLTLDLYFSQNTSSPNGTNVRFFVRWVGTSSGSPSTTGNPIQANAVAVPAINTIGRQTFTLPAFPVNNAPMPEFVMLTIRRDTDTFTGTVALTALRLAYQATR